MFSAFLVVCACCRNKVLQIESGGGGGKSSFSFPFSFPLLEYWFGTSEDKKDFKVPFFCCCLNEDLNQPRVCGSLWCHSAPWRWDGTARPPQPRPFYLVFLTALETEGTGDFQTLSGPLLLRAGLGRGECKNNSLVISNS